ncbi:MAG: archaeal proteasome endopeptidase complex subunit beta [Nitrososphaerota archaeon]|nr:archaeal proteasome endopeptidase complex subunit beta [Candidatus Calditenuaceae archaeon]MDW8073173.1 archaeal proteasome endopeptidase complex subunit beta [Nitrososphaerota archaeon]
MSLRDIPNWINRGPSSIETLSTGTTTVGFTTGDIIVFATDSRATAGFYVAHRKAKKVHKIADHAAMTIAGRVADAQSLIDLMRANARHYEVLHGRRIGVRVLTSLLANFMFSYRWIPFQAQILLGGVDDEGAHLFNVDPFGGCTEEKMIVSGSGSPVAVGVLESEYRPDLSLDEAIKLAFKAVAAAIRRDIGSGDSIDVAYISPATMYRELSVQEKAPLYDQFVRPYLLM